jgi:rubrerythrin
MKRVFASKDRSAIEIVRGLLADEGIRTTVFNEATGSVLGDVPFFLAMPEIWVLADEDAAPARALVERYESGALRASLPKEPWVCPDCGELIEGQFTECWHCLEHDPRDEPDGRCEHCGYLLAGLPLRRCPECGNPF